MDRSNYEITGDGIYCCDGMHDRSDKCDYYKLSSEAIVGLFQEYRSEISALKSQLAERDALIAKKDEALEALLITKAYKEQHGKDEHYETLRACAWVKAEEALALKPKELG